MPRRLTLVYLVLTPKGTRETTGNPTIRFTKNIGVKPNIMHFYKEKQAQAIFKFTRE